MSVFRIRHVKLGGHVHMRVFSARQPNMTDAKPGDLCCSEQEFNDLELAMSGVEFIDEDIYPSNDSQFGVGS
jgi:hypothetical protein